MRKNKNFKFSKSEDNFLIYHYSKVPKNLYFIDIDNTIKIKYEFKVNFDPFSIIYSVNNQPIIEINSEEFLNFEDFRSFNEIEDESNSSIRLDIKYPKINNLYGLPERANDIELTDTIGNDLYRLFNIDKFVYEKDKALGLYGSIPFLQGYSYDNKIITGLIWNNPSETYVKISSLNNDNENNNNNNSKLPYSKNALFISESGIIDLSIFADFNINNYYFKMHKYIGFSPLPPASALGYHQSRWNYKDTNDLFGVDKLFDHYDIPYDSLWLDIEVI